MLADDVNVLPAATPVSASHHIDQIEHTPA